jgi:hypothetical protein
MTRLPHAAARQFRYEFVAVDTKRVTLAVSRVVAPDRPGRLAIVLRVATIPEGAGIWDSASRY